MVTRNMFHRPTSIPEHCLVPASRMEGIFLDEAEIFLKERLGACSNFKTRTGMDILGGKSLQYADMHIKLATDMVKQMLAYSTTVG